MSQAEHFTFGQTVSNRSDSDPEQSGKLQIGCGALPFCGRKFSDSDSVKHRNCLLCLLGYLEHQNLCVTRALEYLAKGKPEQVGNELLKMRSIKVINIDDVPPRAPRNGSVK